MAGKRKRQDASSEVEGHGVNGDKAAKMQDNFHEWLLDILVILKEHDTTPSSFDWPIASTTIDFHEAKRAKLSEDVEKSTIASLIDMKAYTAIDDVVKDLDTATSGLIEELKETINGSAMTFASIQEKQAQIVRATALNRELERLIRVEMFRRPNILNSTQQVKDESSEEMDTKTKIDSSGDNVLTLFADTRPSKQLFSSMRQPVNFHQPLVDVSLPNGITTTKIVPRHSINDMARKPGPTLREVFTPPASLPALPIPKQSRHTATKSSSVNWYNPAEVESRTRSNRRDSYTTQGLSVGQWLTYNVAPSPTQFASPESKRKQRDRTLSFGEPQNPVSPETTAAHNQAKEDALFRSVYSSFAPDRDDSNALVAEQQKDRLWWKKHGESRYLDLLAMKDDGETGQEEMYNGLAEDEINEEDLQEALRTWRPEAGMQEMNASSHLTTKVPDNSEEADILLREISDLLETLDSHQRVRNLTLTPATNARTGSGPSLQLSGMPGSPTIPSSAEIDVYETLKNQLVLIVSTLPPYLLSKLDGDKLGALKISTKLHVESKNQRGTMEEGEASAAIRARSTAPPPLPASSAYPSVPARGSNYLQAAATPARQYPGGGYAASTAPRPATNSSYLQNPQYSNRPSNYSSGQARPSYPAQGGYTTQPAASASAARYNYGTQYGQQSQSSYGSYQNGYRPYAGQNASNYNYNSQYATPQARPSSQASQAYRGSQTEYQQRPVPPQGYGYGSAHGGSASPQNQNRSSYSGQPQGSNQRPPLY
ncbi:hypothetical protein N7G274_007683 [Stereocaulon virgatum]|uniref:Uncharacterized protein n=1 Tax=Stereocaulon virgatum TaxID=373712 RepID=A0ABR4A3A9_9LECA